ncbi:zf-HC2 domain-containing protein, partial [Myxococcota bacterium]|nr:zf-HC2 domain-containing protein [Myxococcota bacterium]
MDATTKTTIEESISPWLDGELSSGDRAAFEAALSNDPALSAMAEEFKASTRAFAVYRSQKIEEP